MHCLNLDVRVVPQADVGDAAADLRRLPAQVRTRTLILSHVGLLPQSKLLH